MKRVRFRFSKDYGATKKGTVKTLSMFHVMLLEKEKVGNIVKPKADKTDKGATERQTK